MQDLLTIQSMLHAYGDFCECVVETVIWSDYGATVSVTLDYVWEGDLVRSGGPKRLVTLEFSLVQEVTMVNAFPPPAIADPSLINWSHNEVSIVKVGSDERSKRYNTGGVEFFHAKFLREENCWIDIVFGSLTISEAGTVVSR